MSGRRRSWRCCRGGSRRSPTAPTRRREQGRSRRHREDEGLGLQARTLADVGTRNETPAPRCEARAQRIAVLDADRRVHRILRRLRAGSRHCGSETIDLFEQSSRLASGDQRGRCVGRSAGRGPGCDRSVRRRNAPSTKRMSPAGWATAASTRCVPRVPESTCPQAGSCSFCAVACCGSHDAASWRPAPAPIRQYRGNRCRHRDAAEPSHGARLLAGDCPNAKCQSPFPIAPAPVSIAGVAGRRSREEAREPEAVQLGPAKVNRIASLMRSL